MPEAPPPDAASEHAFARAPHRTLVSLSVPVLLSLVAEPLTGLVDTAFVARLGVEPLAALGVGTIVLSSIYWIFNFLGIGTQTEVAQAFGRQAPQQATRINGLALVMSGLFGVLMLALGWFGAAPAATYMGATGLMHTQAVTYMQIRLLGAPAVLATLAAFGTLRGLQDMRTPLWVALGINGLNIALDAPLVFGLGPIPALGVAGAALATTGSQWIGALWVARAVYTRLGWPPQLRMSDARTLLHVGGDLFVRTGLLTVFLLLTTRAATRISADAGAAHQAIRQVWTFTALFLDAFAITGQSLVAYFVGARRKTQARRVASVVCIWSTGTGIVLGMGMWLGTGAITHLLVPAGARALFGPAWFITAATQPRNARSFGTDGIHWGTGDFRYLRNAVFVATTVGATALLVLDKTRPDAFLWVWIITAAWIGIRAAFGLIRIWPGVWHAPLAFNEDEAA